MADRLAWIAWWDDDDGRRECEWSWHAMEAEAREHYADREPDELVRAPGLDGQRYGTESADALRALGVISLDGPVCDDCQGNDPTDGRAPRLDPCSDCHRCDACGCECEEPDDG